MLMQLDPFRQHLAQSQREKRQFKHEFSAIYCVSVVFQ